MTSDHSAEFVSLVPLQCISFSHFVLHLCLVSILALSLLPQGSLPHAVPYSAATWRPPSKRVKTAAELKQCIDACIERTPTRVLVRKCCFFVAVYGISNVSRTYIRGPRRQRLSRTIPLWPAHAKQTSYARHIQHPGISWLDSKLSWAILPWPRSEINSDPLNLSSDKLSFGPNTTHSEWGEYFQCRSGSIWAALSIIQPHCRRQSDSYLWSCRMRKGWRKGQESECANGPIEGARVYVSRLLPSAPVDRPNLRWRCRCSSQRDLRAPPD